MLQILDILGNKVADLVNETKPEGVYSVAFDGSNLPSGIYVNVLQCGDYFEAQKMTLLK